MKILKLLMIGIGATLLSACSVFSYLTPRQFDSVEYGSTIEVTQDATRLAHACTDKGGANFGKFLEQINTRSMYLQEYTAHKKDNEDAQKGALQIRALVLELDKHEQGLMTPRYCVEKTSNIQSASRTLSRSLGREGKFDYCKQDLTVAFARLKSFSSSGEISQVEYVELGNDMIRLARVNVSACSLLDREKIETAISIIQKALPILTGL